jgi:hypothetical protein
MVLLATSGDNINVIIIIMVPVGAARDDFKGVLLIE